MLTVGNYYKHLMLYHDQRFPTTLVLVLNTVMRHQALQAGRVYVCQNRYDGYLTIDELREMASHGSDDLSNCVHFGASLHGIRQTEESSYSSSGHTWPFNSIPYT